MGISYNTDHSLKSLNEGGQAGALRDLKKIRELSERYDLKNPEIAFEVYEQIISDPYYFETDTGKKFQRELIKTAIRSDSYLLDETAMSGRKSKEKKTKEKAVKSVKYDKSKKKRGILVFLAVVCSVVLVVNLYEMIRYQVLSYQSAKKIEELISCILEPIETSVSEENRLDDLLASGLIPTMPPKNPQSLYMEPVIAQGSQILYKYSALYERNNDMIGWIRIDDTVINYPIMQTKEDEEYYLLRDFDKNDDINGLPFLDARCDIELNGTNLIVYGHNMKNGSMFSKLLNYEKQSFYLEHPTIVFDTIYEEGVYDIIAVFQTKVAYQDEDVFRYYNMIQAETEEDFTTYINEIKEMSFYEIEETAEYGDDLLTLSTCDRRISQGRFVVVAKKRK